jgi:hypothetical protein
MTDRITAAEFNAQQAEPARKYGNEKITVQGIKFDSKREANRWLVLRDMQKRGEITDLRRQVSFGLVVAGVPILTRNGGVMRYIADFTYDIPSGERVIEDAKGFRTKDYEIKAAIMRAMGFVVKEV